MSTGCAGFDNCDTSTLAGKTISLTGGASLGTAFGRGGDRGVRLLNATATITPKWGASKKLFFGMGFRTPAATASSYATIEMRSTAGVQGTFRIYADGTVEVYRGVSTALLESAPPGSFPSQIMQQLVVGYEVDAAAGDVFVQAGNTVLINAVGAHNTLGAGTVEEITQITVDDHGFSEVWFVHPWWSDDSNHGTKRILTQRLVADGDHTAWTPSSGSDRTAMLNETLASNADATKVSTNAVGAKGSHSVQQLPSDVTGIALVQPCWFGNVDDASSRTLQGGSRSGADVDGDTTAIGISQTPAFHIFPMLTDPSDAGAWTVTKFNEVGREFYYKLAS